MAYWNKEYIVKVSYWKSYRLGILRMCNLNLAKNCYHNCKGFVRVNNRDNCVSTAIRAQIVLSMFIKTSDTSPKNLTRKTLDTVWHLMIRVLMIWKLTCLYIYFLRYEGGNLVHCLIFLLLSARTTSLALIALWIVKQGKAWKYWLCGHIDYFVFIHENFCFVLFRFVFFAFCSVGVLSVND